MRLERLSPANTQAALDYLTRAPYDNVLLSYLISFDRSAATRNLIVVAQSDERVYGVGYFGRQLVIGCEAVAIDAFVRRAHRQGGERSISGPRSAVAELWNRLRVDRPQPRLIRDRQLTMMLDRPRLRQRTASVSVRLARPDEWHCVAENSARMIEGELAYGAGVSSAEFAATVRAMIAHSRWWVGDLLGQKCFYCSIGPWCHVTAQLQGIWTPPEFRGRGLATASLSKICDVLLKNVPTLCLHVNDFNEEAIALYRRVGFEHVSDYQTILFA